jgi:hypothetical protein
MPPKPTPKATVEKRGYDPAIGVDGWPLDARQPCYQGESGSE